MYNKYKILHLYVLTVASGGVRYYDDKLIHSYLTAFDR